MRKFSSGFAVLVVVLGLVIGFPEVRAQSPAQLPDFADLVEKNGAAVVNVSTRGRVGANRLPFQLDENDPFFEFYRRFFQPPRGQAPQSPRNNREPPLRDLGQGSGFIVSADGYILTNAHVVKNADEVNVTLNDRRELKAKVVGADERTDVALLKVEASGLPTVRIGNPDRSRVGEWVLAIGSPFGLENTVTAGIISSKGRNTDGGDVRFIQTDVAVNPGNSGGPLFNLKGEVIGINSQIYSRSGGYMGVSFAIPIDTAMNVYEQLKGTGKVTRGRIGVQIGPVTKDLAAALNLGKPQGAYVADVEKDTPASRGGIQQGDVILKIDGKVMEDNSDVRRTIGAVRPGSKTVVTVWRDGATKDLTLTVAELKDDRVASAAPKKADPKAKSDAKSEKLGIAVVDLSAEQKKDAKVEKGALVEAVNGPAEQVVKPGDVILRVNNTEIVNAKQFREVAAKVDTKKPIALLVRGDNATTLRILKLDE
jgi:serine protease Do